MADDLLQTTLEFDVGGDAYVFRIPSFTDEIKLGLLERSIRVRLEREVLPANVPATGLPTGDGSTDFLVTVAATFEYLLLRGPKWVYSNGQNGEPVIDYQKWPNDKVMTAANVVTRYQAELSRFRSGGTPNGQSAGGEAVASEPNSGDQPV